MQLAVCPDIGAIYSRDPRDPSVLVVDGYGIDLRVERGHLQISDGMGANRRVRRLPRAQRTVRRIVLLGHTGTVTLHALRWCADVGIALTQLDLDGRHLASLAPAQHHDPRLIRAQALAQATGHAVPIAIYLIEAKLVGQAHVAASLLSDPATANAIHEGRKGLAEATSVADVLSIEATAAREYFAAWRGLKVQFAKRNAEHVPEAWLRFDQRTSTRAAGSSPRAASDPVNALLNYLYTLASAETRLACQALGLDPGLGVLHVDKKDRDSLALDLLEPIRPLVDTYILRTVAGHKFRRTDFTETADGRCRLLAPLTHMLAETAPTWAAAVAPYAEHVAHELGAAATGTVKMRRPLTGKPRSSTRLPIRPKAAAAMLQANCPDCGQPLLDRRRLRCPDCHKAARTAIAGERARQTAARLAELQQARPRPSGAVMRSARVAAHRAAAAAWEADHPDAVIDLDHYRSQILPPLQPIPIADIGAALGVGHDAAWRIREGTLTPHARHWAALAELARYRQGPA